MIKINLYSGDGGWVCARMATNWEDARDDQIQSAQGQGSIYFFFFYFAFCIPRVYLNYSYFWVSVLTGYWYRAGWTGNGIHFVLQKLLRFNHKSWCYRRFCLRKITMMCQTFVLYMVLSIQWNVTSLNISNNYKWKFSEGRFSIGSFPRCANHLGEYDDRRRVASRSQGKKRLYAINWIRSIHLLSVQTGPHFRSLRPEGVAALATVSPTPAPKSTRATVSETATTTATKTVKGSSTTPIVIPTATPKEKEVRLTIKKILNLWLWGIVELRQYLEGAVYR